MSALVVVTGGSAGIGRAVLARAPEGAERVDVSRRGPDLADVDHVAADLADPAAWGRVGGELARRIRSSSAGRITVVLNAGTLRPIGFLGEVDPVELTSHVLLNSAAPQVLTTYVLAALRDAAATRRELVLISSGAARTARPGWATYGASKAAVDHLVRAADLERRERGGTDRPAPRVLAVAPGVVATDMQAAIRASDDRDFPGAERFRRLHRAGELADPDDVADRLWQLLDDADADAELGPVVDLRDR